MFKKIFLTILLASSASAFNGHGPATFAQKHMSETALKMSGGNVAPALKVKIDSICIILG
jgi:hypothetical protein